ncbi:universal stress protein PHOS32-like protein [Tanacetum coccineum]
MSLPSSSLPPSPSPSPQRKVAIAVDLSDESAYPVQWAVQHYLRHDDSVILLHIQPTSALYGADWGPQQKPFDIDSFTSAKANEIAKPFPDGEVGSPSRVGHDGNEGGLFPVPEEEPEFHDSSDKQTG